VILLLSLFAIMYMGTPIVIWLTMRQNANPSLQSYGHELTDPGFQFLTESAAQMQAMGFELVGYFGYVGQTKNVNTFIAYLIHRRNGDGGVAAMAVTAQGVGARMVEFSTRFADQGSVTTGNSKTIGVYVRPYHKPVYQFPGIQDPFRLYEIHQQLMVKSKPGMAKDIVQPGQEEARLVDGIRREMQDQLAPGILRLDSDGAFYRPTLFGAYRMTWRLLFPLKHVLSIARSMRAKRLEKELLVNPLTPIHP
jgi:hypothetical protein